MRIELDYSQTTVKLQLYPRGKDLIMNNYAIAINYTGEDDGKLCFVCVDGKGLLSVPEANDGKAKAERMSYDKAIANCPRVAKMVDVPVERVFPYQLEDDESSAAPNSRTDEF
jgi:hypothetical protein